MTHSMAQRQQDQIERRLRELGIHTRMLDGHRTLLGSLRVGPAPFETLDGSSRRVKTVVFSTVGPDRIKCLRPRFLFQLPLQKILDCHSAADLESRIRQAWRAHCERLRNTRAWLSSLGADPEIADNESLTLPIDGEDQATRVTWIDSHRLVLPGSGPLSGIALEEAEDRVLRLARTSVASGVDVEIAISERLGALARAHAQRREAEFRHNPYEQAPLATVVDERPRRVLLVGPRLADGRAYAESLRLRGYAVDAVRTFEEALAATNVVSPELVLADMQLGRSDGIELVVMLREAGGIEDLPVVLVDSTRRPARRQAAREAGAAGYLVHPLDISKIAPNLERMISAPQRRRFTRYEKRLSVRIAGVEQPGLVTALGRGGMFLATDRDLQSRRVHRCVVTLAELGETLRVEAEVLYRVGGAAAACRGVGMRFHAFPNADEAVLIDYLKHLDAKSAGLGQVL
ncbi:MAG: response regulator [Proteobacteria bacterium]|nr:response regulator [Pseudomonadota bacterium]